MLAISLGSTPVGTIVRRPGRLTVFKFDDAYLDLADRPVLGRWFEDHLGPSFEEVERGDRLIPYFRNCLPEERGELRRLLAAAACVSVRDDWGLLAHVGDDLPGALFVASLGARAARAPGGAAPAALAAPTLAFSLAGLQLKYSMIQQGNRFTLPMKGQGGRWIVKLPDPRFARVPEVEHATLRLAQACGITVPEARLVSIAELEIPGAPAFAEVTALAVRRFDRTDAGGRIHQEDFAQVVNRPPEQKYEGSYGRLGKIVRAVCGEADFDEFVRRLAFAILIGNADAHLKNWSLLYEDPKRPRLSPAYDLVPVVVYLNGASRLALSLSREKRFDQLKGEHFAKLAAEAGAPVGRVLHVVSSIAALVREQLAHEYGGLPLTAEQGRTLQRHVEALSI
jgi:serine/threonine-protein kinase HipA